MKQLKSGKQRRREIQQARRQRRAKPARYGHALTTGMVPVSTGLLRPNNSYSAPDFVVRGHYQDLPFRCIDCDAECVWTAEKQRWWYEVAKGDVFTTARRCAACRARERLRKEAARQAWREGLTRKCLRKSLAT